MFIHRKRIDYFLIFIKGLFMGAADVIPGVSGGTIAFISGIYQELIFSINQIDIKSIQIIKNQGFASFWKYINGNFLLCLASGIATSIFSLSKFVTWTIDKYPTMIWSFFFGLIISSIYYLYKDLKNQWRLSDIICFSVGLIAAYSLATMPVLSYNNSYFFLFICGMLAICAMILPGISGAFILLMLGVYSTILQAISDMNFHILSVFGCGAIVGLLIFSRVLKWLFIHYKLSTTATLIGFITGSLYKIWPWKEVASFHSNNQAITKPFISSNKHLTENTLPDFSNYNEILMAFCCMCIGFFLIFTLETIANRIKK